MYEFHTHTHTQLSSCLPRLQFVHTALLLLSVSSEYVAWMQQHCLFEVTDQYQCVTVTWHSIVMHKAIVLLWYNEHVVWRKLLFCAVLESDIAGCLLFLNTLMHWLCWVLSRLYVLPYIILWHLLCFFNVKWDLAQNLQNMLTFHIFVNFVSMGKTFFIYKFSLMSLHCQRTGNLSICIFYCVIYIYFFDGYTNYCWRCLCCWTVWMQTSCCHNLVFFVTGSMHWHRQTLWTLDLKNIIEA